MEPECSSENRSAADRSSADRSVVDSSSADRSSADRSTAEKSSARSSAGKISCDQESAGEAQKKTVIETELQEKHTEIELGEKFIVCNDLYVLLWYSLVLNNHEAYFVIFCLFPAYMSY